MTLIDVFCKDLGLSFEGFIEQYHWKRGLNLSQIARLSGITRQAWSSACDKRLVKRRSHRESVIPKRGKEHWAFGKNKENSKIHLASSERMRRKNPSHNFETRSKAAIKRAEYFKKNPWPQESEVASLLASLGVSFEFQKPIGPFVIDFFFDKLGLCLEIDSTRNWGEDKRRKAIAKDKWLKSEGFKVLRVDKRKISDRSFMHKVLKAHNVIGH